MTATRAVSPKRSERREASTRCRCCHESMRRHSWGSENTCLVSHGCGRPFRAKHLPGHLWCWALSAGTRTSASFGNISTVDNTDRTARSLLTVAEVANELRVTRGTAYRWIRSGKLPSVRIAGTVRVPAKLLVDRLRRSAAP